MSRLTQRNFDGSVGISQFRYYNYDDFQKLARKLADYEDLEEQGLLLKLPCKVGDTVYAITRDIISEYRICKINVYLEGIFYDWTCEKGIYPSLPYANIQGFLPYEINKTVFLTKEEAEQELKKQV